MRLALLASVMALFLGGCAERQVSGIKAKHISPTEFTTRYQSVDKAGTMMMTSYGGESDGKAFLHVGSMSTLSRKWNDQWYYVLLTELEPAFRAGLPQKGFQIESK